MTEDEAPTATQFREAITNALADHKVEAAVAILGAMAVRHPREAEEVLNTLEFGIALVRAGPLLKRAKS